MIVSTLCPRPSTRRPGVLRRIVSVVGVVLSSGDARVKRAPQACALAATSFGRNRNLFTNPVSNLHRIAYYLASDVAFIAAAVGIFRTRGKR